MEKQVFNKGDFVKYSAYSGNNNVTFGIFEGVDLSPDYQYTKKYSLAAYYDSHKYCSNIDGGGWGYKPILDVAKPKKPCEKTIDTLIEDSWWSLCTPTEKEQALEVLASFGYLWDDKTLSLIDIQTGEIVHRIIIPKIEYHGDTIKPICEELKNRLKKSVIAKNKTSYSSTPCYRGTPYGGYNGFDDECWD